MRAGKLVHNIRQQGGGQGLVAADPDLACGGIGQEVELLNSLAELVEYVGAPAKKRLAIKGGRDALWTAIQQAQADGMFEIGECLGDGRLGDRQALGGLCHAAFLGSGEQHVKIAQAQPAADPRGPALLWRHNHMLNLLSLNCAFCL